MYIELDDLVCHMLSCSEAFFDIDNYLLYYRSELPSDADSINILQLPKVDETRVIESFIDKHPHLRRKIERQNKALADGFHRIVNDEGLYDEWTQFRWAFLQDVAADCAVNNKSFNMKEAAGSTIMGALSGGLGGNGSNYKNVLTDTINGTKKVIAREMRRENKKYANKVIKSAVASKNNTLALAFWSGSASFTLGCGISNRVSCLFSRWFK